MKANAKEQTPDEKFRHFTKQIIAIPKAEIDRRENEYKKTRAHKKRRTL